MSLPKPSLWLPFRESYANQAGLIIVDPNGMIVNDWTYGGAGAEAIFEGDGLAKELETLLHGKK